MFWVENKGTCKIAGEPVRVSAPSPFVFCSVHFLWLGRPLVRPSITFQSRSTPTLVQPHASGIGPVGFLFLVSKYYMSGHDNGQLFYSEDVCGP